MSLVLPDQCMEFFVSELSKATRSFNRSTVIGRGGYGTVYKGELRYQTVAIKVLTQVLSVIRVDSLCYFLLGRKCGFSWWV